MTKPSSKVRAILEMSRWTNVEAKVVLKIALEQGSLNAFATRHDLDPSRLYRWQKKFDESSTDESVGFREVEMIEACEFSSCKDDRIEIVLPSGYVVRVGPSFDDIALRRTLAVLDDGSSSW